VVTDPSRTETSIMAREAAFATRVLRTAAPAARRAGLDLRRLQLEPQAGADPAAASAGRQTTVAAHLRRLAAPTARPHRRSTP